MSASNTKKLKALKQKRNGYRSNAVKYISKAQDVIKQDLESDPRETYKIHAQLKDLQSKLDNFNNQIIDLTPEDAVEEEIKAFNTFMIELNEISVDLEVLHNAMLEIKLLQENQNRYNNTTDNDTLNANQGHGASIRLPKLEIPKFNGDPLLWQEFWDIFESTVNNNTRLVPVDKFNYLKASLIGEAKDSITGIAITNLNYNVAIEILKNRFGRNQTVIHAHFLELFQLETVVNSHGPQLRQMFDVCEKHIRSLGALGVREDQFGMVFVPLILSKLPGDIVIELNRKNSCLDWTLRQLRKLLEGEILARELLSKRLGDNIIMNKIRNSVPLQENQNNLTTTQSLFVNSKPNFPCVFCNGNHFNDECTEFTNVSARKAQIFDRCFNCLRKGHDVPNCQRQKPCYHCKQIKSHHSSLCLNKFDKVNYENTLAQTPKESEIDMSDTTTMLAHGSQVLMQTATANCLNQNGEGHLTRLVFDSGSSRTFITQDLCENLHLKPHRYEIINLATFGSNRTQEIKSAVVSIKVQLKNRQFITIEANVVPTISCPVHMPRIHIDKESILNQIHLADQFLNSNNSMKIDLLIGIDYYFNIIQEQRITCKSGLVALHSKLGWILTGKFSKNTPETNQHSLLISESNHKHKMTNFIKAKGLDQNKVFSLKYEQKKIRRNEKCKTEDVYKLKPKPSNATYWKVQKSSLPKEDYDNLNEKINLKSHKLIQNRKHNITRMQPQDVAKSGKYI